LALSRDRRTIVTGDGLPQFPIETNQPRSIRSFDIYTGKELGHIPDQDSDVRALCFSPDEKQLIAGYQNTSLLVWDTALVLPSKQKPAVDMPVQELESLWQSLVEKNPAKAYPAMAKLMEGSEETVDF